jgi:hypothetical protein
MELPIDDLQETESKSEQLKKRKQELATRVKTTQLSTDLRRFVEDIDPDLPPNFVMLLHGVPYIRKAGLLWLGKKAGVVGIVTEPLQFQHETDGRRAIFRATATLYNGGVYSAIGVADINNVQMTTLHNQLDHLAQTRAINIVLRNVTNCGVVSVEELPTVKVDETNQFGYSADPPPSESDMEQDMVKDPDGPSATEIPAKERRGGQRV